ncbi:aldo/keto reductase [Brochothrix thermosphacta]|uniref:Putative oxidoreductase, aldo/keto reductase family protein n=1 Tax=Brochothrix thermosphacta TaxID=2756 RepID=A0A2X0SAV3_BROTH|nr:aldo/keto reductase [Brochothrix thermosphacta]ANZ95418.1 aldo/keto reductase [Brochothrix thermosphacta]MDO7863899.1 aldo/keto reductase [Brochothrix thermosphacta]SPP29001.1 putative oxidoreductase, aldo/keto reductase family protein [Brochothrix thermosphacta]HCZ39100.1 aldo/keto reductase [Brochothrix thermosphacta]HCZ45253.1 aldo/keto reductase [Brochothrix thermosphacta]
MKQIQLGQSNLKVSDIALGCMRMSSLEISEAAKVLDASIAGGINFFDHADIYGGGESEVVFSKAIKELNVSRENLILQSKCGITKQGFNFSKGHIVDSVDGILKRLDTDYLDLLVLHRPDALMEPEEIASAFNELEKNGKVRQFGVSNQNPQQIELLKTAIEQPLVVNQLQFGLKHTGMLDEGFNVNNIYQGEQPSAGLLEYSRREKMTIQAWSPLQYGYFEGVFIGHEKFPELNAALDKLANKYEVSSSAIAIAWILRHPAKMQVLLGSMNVSRIESMIKATDVYLTHEEWYELYKVAGNILP